MSAYGKALGQHIPFEGRLAIGFKIMAPRYLVCVSLNRKFSLCL